ncbi:UvrB/UvrC motif-containing protein [Candidatus Contubernalis alkaliaceticus]|uniref:UvrB/UvrC motif-containing protein n=1 Tax=Candidatus Contubernalis alkaliaceticus TaxID=338645 RepID=UPI001F4C0B52|nr:UvrB/UvrC motif-containing protein [Candidatus Contubernalis alkalaceticus]UNC93387.1 UvrB/UvrC motif-containing protein [Candidatus Contubernalis alkalaceticus]
MLCQECQKNNAVVHLTKIINDKKTEMHLCQECANNKGELELTLEPNFSLHHFFAGLLDLEGFETTVDIPSSTKIQCEGCGLTYAQFSQIGRLGCAKCYEHFGEKLGVLLKRIHGSIQHTGKVPERSGSLIKVKKEIEKLRAALQQKIMNEEFEEAAVIRDKIRELDREVVESGEKQND